MFYALGMQSLLSIFTCGSLWYTHHDHGLPFSRARVWFVSSNSDTTLTALSASHSGFLETYWQTNSQNLLFSSCSPCRNDRH